MCLTFVGTTISLNSRQVVGQPPGAAPEALETPERIVSAAANGANTQTRGKANGADSVKQGTDCKLSRAAALPQCDLDRVHIRTTHHGSHPGSFY